MSEIRDATKADMPTPADMTVPAHNKPASAGMIYFQSMSKDAALIQTASPPNNAARTVTFFLPETDALKLGIVD